MKDNRQNSSRWKDKKFDYAVRAIFLFAVIVSFSDTISLYKSVGFNEQIDFLNRITGTNWFTLALFATLAAEAAFTVGLWGLYEVYEQTRKFPSPLRYWAMWLLFLGGVAIVGWSNMGRTVGLNFLLGQPTKGIALGLSIPYFVLGSVLVNFTRKHGGDEVDETKVEDKKVDAMGWMDILKVAAMKRLDVSKVDDKVDGRKADDHQAERMKVDGETAIPFKVERMETVKTAAVDVVDEMDEVVEVATGKADTVRVDASNVVDSNKVDGVKVGAAKWMDEPKVDEQKVASTKVDGKVDKKQVDGVDDTTNVDGLDEVIECAKRIQQETGKLPGRKKLAQVAGCGEWIARRALAEMKKTG